MTRKKYNRVMIKLSGEALTENGSGAYSSEKISAVVKCFSSFSSPDLKLAISIGGGNIWRGNDWKGVINEERAHYIGMLGTVMNAAVFAERLSIIGADASCYSRLSVPSVMQDFDKKSAVKDFEDGKIVVLGGGVGKPFVSSDSGAAQNAADLGCELIIKLTSVDGVYDKDPNKYPDAIRYDELTIQEALDWRLGIMDRAAFEKCQQKGINIIVCKSVHGVIKSILSGEHVGTLVRAK